MWIQDVRLHVYNYLSSLFLNSSGFLFFFSSLSILIIDYVSKFFYIHFISIRRNTSKNVFLFSLLSASDIFIGRSSKGPPPPKAIKGTKTKPLFHKESFVHSPLKSFFFPDICAIVKRTQILLKFPSLLFSLLLLLCIEISKHNGISINRIS